MIMHVKKAANGGFILLLKAINAQLNNPVTTAASTKTDIKGEKSRTSRKHEMRNSARKNHRIMFGGELFSILPPILRDGVGGSSGCKELCLQTNFSV